MGSEVGYDSIVLPYVTIPLAKPFILPVNFKYKMGK
jgi:hypothetical protein